MSKEVNNEEGQYEEPDEAQGYNELNEGEYAEFDEPDEAQGYDELDEGNVSAAESSEERGKKSG
jgi:hypothetical protein